MNKRWQGRLNELLKEENTLHNTTTTLREAPTPVSIRWRDAGLVKTETYQNPTPKTPKTLLGGSVFSENAQNLTPKTPKTPPEAEPLGLVATWSREFGYVSIHDPTAGEWFDVATRDVPDWAKREAFKRKELYREGNRKAFRLTAREMEDIWEKERVEMWEHPAVTDRGIVYEDYLEEEE